MGYGLIGIWIGKTISDSGIAISYAILLYSFDWVKITQETVERQAIENYLNVDSFASNFESKGD